MYKNVLDIFQREVFHDEILVVFMKMFKVMQQQTSSPIFGMAFLQKITNQLLVPNAIIGYEYYYYVKC